MSFKIVDLRLSVVENLVDLRDVQAGKGTISCKTGGSADCKKRSKNLSCVGTSINMLMDFMELSSSMEDDQLASLRKEVGQVLKKYSKD